MGYEVSTCSSFIKIMPVTATDLSHRLKEPKNAGGGGGGEREEGGREGGGKKRKIIFL